MPKFNILSFNKFLYYTNIIHNYIAYIIFNFHPLIKVTKLNIHSCTKYFRVKSNIRARTLKLTNITLSCFETNSE